MKHGMGIIVLILWSGVANAQFVFYATPPKDRDAVREWIGAALVPLKSVRDDDHKTDRVEILGRAAVIDGVLGDEAAYRSHIAAATAVYTSGMEALGASLMNVEARACLIRTKVLDGDLPAAQRIAGEWDAMLKKRETARYAEREREAMLRALCGQNRFDQAIAIAKAQPETIRQNCLELVAMDMVQCGDTAGATSLLGSDPNAAAKIAAVRLQTLLRQGNVAEARALVPASGNQMATQWVELLAKQGKLAEATEAVQLCQEQNREWALVTVARAKAKAGDLPGAMAMLEQVKDPSVMRHAIAIQLLARGEPDQAVAMMEGVTAPQWHLSNFTARLARADAPAKAEPLLAKITDPHMLRPAQLAIAAAYLRAGKQADYRRVLQLVVEAAQAGMLNTNAPDADSELRTMADLLARDDLAPLREVWQAIPDKQARTGLIVRAIAGQLEAHGADAGKTIFDAALAAESSYSRSAAFRIITWTLAREGRKGDATKWIAAEKDPVVQANGCMGFAENLAGLDVGSIQARMSFPSRRPASFFDE